MSRLLSDDEVTTQLEGLPGWTREGDAIVATIEAPDFPAAVRIVVRRGRRGRADEPPPRHRHPVAHHVVAADDPRRRRPDPARRRAGAPDLGRRPRGRRHARWLTRRPALPRTVVPEHGETHGGSSAGRLNWLRAAVLGANDGIVSTAGLVVGVAAASASRGPVLAAGVAGLAAGALSMAVGEYVSVSTQRDTEEALLAKEVRELRRGARGRARRARRDLRGQGPVARARAPGRRRAHRPRRPRRPRRGRAADRPRQPHEPLAGRLASMTAFTVGALLPLLAIVLPPVVRARPGDDGRGRPRPRRPPASSAPGSASPTRAGPPCGSSPAASSRWRSPTRSASFVGIHV